MANAAAFDVTGTAMLARVDPASYQISGAWAVEKRGYTPSFELLVPTDPTRPLARWQTIAREAHGSDVTTYTVTPERAWRGIAA